MELYLILSAAIPIGIIVSSYIKKYVDDYKKEISDINYESEIHQRAELVYDYVEKNDSLPGNKEFKNSDGNWYIKSNDFARMPTPANQNCEFIHNTCGSIRNTPIVFGTIDSCGRIMNAPTSSMGFVDNKPISSGQFLSIDEDNTYNELRAAISQANKVKNEAMARAEIEVRKKLHPSIAEILNSSDGEYDDFGLYEADDEVDDCLTDEEREKYKSDLISAHTHIFKGLSIPTTNRKW